MTPGITHATPLARPEKKEKEISLIDFDHVSQTNSSILNTFMSLHVLTEFGRRVGGRVEGGTNPSDGIGSHALGLSARHAQDVKWPSTPLATPWSRGLSGFGDNDIAASIKIHIN